MINTISKSLQFLLLFILLSTFAFGKDYTVIKGDTLSKIAEKELGSKSRWNEIATLNDLKPPYQIKFNQKLKLPDNTTQEPMQSEISENEPAKIKDEGEKFLDGLIKQLLIWGFFSFLFSLIYMTFSIRGGCWFSLVETTIGASFLLALFISLMTIVSLATFVLLVYLNFKTQLPSVAFYATGFILFCAYIVATILTAKKLLKCFWRSLITVYIMTIFVGHFCVFITLWLLTVVLPDILSIELIKALWQEIPF